MEKEEDKQVNNIKKKLILKKKKVINSIQNEINVVKVVNQYSKI